ncbi:hypothetical protein Paes_1741 [Prosthecochloris aestuarii DSM 271]|uniref:Uncharacterized protein n=1 Tax=Prosthecochloris aestuarii (strain DSM 271 / SK 413) TaxID=290512 RepID=B4S3M0_PROA2|nr:hypothetical protein Paes_1741 [Prosthecochloris aestuarii DSM 271]
MLFLFSIRLFFWLFGGLKLLITFFENLGISTFDFTLWGNIANVVESFIVVSLDMKVLYIGPRTGEIPNFTDIAS